MAALIIIIFFVGIIIFSSVVYARKTESKNKRDEAAQVMLKDEYLDHMLTNPLIHGNTEAPDRNNRVMLYIETCNVKPAAKYVFDPSKKVFIGRDRQQCNVCISEATVSSRNCAIVSMGNSLVLQDLNSANGTLVKRGFFKKYHLHNTQIVLRSNDRIVVGLTTLKLMIFDYNSITI
ncbi:MAG: FHA domain-containing protein [Porcipelethomonas sp.]